MMNEDLFQKAKVSELDSSLKQKTSPRHVDGVFIAIENGIREKGKNRVQGFEEKIIEVLVK